MKPKPAPIPGFHPGRHLQMLDDPRNDPYAGREKLREPVVCSDCGAIYQNGRWQWGIAESGGHRTRCSACRRIHENAAAGYVTIEGKFTSTQQEEILGLIRNLEAREKAEHPLQRIMAIEKQNGGLLITTTDIHLARSIGDALQHAYQGELDFHYNQDEYLLRVRWQA